MFKHPSRTAAALLLATAALASAPGTRAQVFKTPGGTQQPAATPPVVTPAAPQPQGGAQLVRSEGHEWARQGETVEQRLKQRLDNKDVTFKGRKEGGPTDPRERAKGKMLVLRVYIAPWSENWKNEPPTDWRLYDKNKAHGFEVVGDS